MPPDPFFSGEGLDRADHLRADPAAVAAFLDRPDARELQWVEGAPALDEEGKLCWGAVTGEPPLFLGFDNGAPRFSSLPDGSTPANAYAHIHLLAQLDARDAPTFSAALSLANWHRRHSHCSVCGHRTEPNRGGWSRACPNCGAEHYPRSDPVVIMLAEHEGKLLLGRQPQYPPGRYSALAGFVEPGESIENAVARELKEEAGIEVGDVRYLCSQPWPFPSSLMIGAHSIAASDQLEIDRNELDDARWFSRDEVVAALAGDASAPFQAPPKWAIARTLLERWVDGLM
ncbi:NAD(+) diphosphatase [Sphingomonas sp. RB56-2]|uniref:NAD(+) diphosphatase n=1 Tax=Sphingomonas brevis TaxID=2908206 RepID=A0ABT0SC77_9SPHN|nr:NAD(+) diphosphatase [Sphingomonas brevis]MCL6742021.1 NAD(+) diphosphatase [Sphingomonas brevis]